MGRSWSEVIPFKNIYFLFSADIFRDGREKVRTECCILAGDRFMNIQFLNFLYHVWYI